MKGYIYIILSSHYAKVGFATNVKRRLRELSRWNGELSVYSIYDASLTTEKQIHSALAHIAISKSEWYPIDKLDYIQKAVQTIVQRVERFNDT